MKHHLLFMSLLSNMVLKTCTCPVPLSFLARNEPWNITSDNVSGTIGIESRTIHNGSGTIRNEYGTIQNESITIHDESGTIHNESATTHNDTASGTLEYFVRLSRGGYKLLPDDTVVIERRNLTLKRHEEIKFNSILFCNSITPNLCGMKWTLSVTSHLISYTTFLLSLLQQVRNGEVVTLFAQGIHEINRILLACYMILTSLNSVMLYYRINIETGLIIEMYVQLFISALYFWLSSIALDSMINFTQVLGRIVGRRPHRDNFQILLVSLFIRLMVIELATFAYDLLLNPVSESEKLGSSCSISVLPLCIYYTPHVMIYSFGSFCNWVLFAFCPFLKKRLTGMDREVMKEAFAFLWGFWISLPAIWYLPRLVRPTFLFYNFFKVFVLGSFIFLWKLKTELWLEDYELLDLLLDQAN